MIRRIEISEINNYIKEAEKSGLTFCSTTILYGLVENKEIVAFTGIIFKKNKVIFKNHYVPIKYRGMGYFKLLLSYSIFLSKSMNYKIAEATCTEMSIKEYLNKGFKVVKKYKLYTKVRNENI